MKPIVLLCMCLSVGCGAMNARVGIAGDRAEVAFEAQVETEQHVSVEAAATSWVSGISSQRVGALWLSDRHAISAHYVAVGFQIVSNDVTYIEGVGGYVEVGLRATMEPLLVEVALHSMGYFDRAGDDVAATMWAARLGFVF